MKREKEILVVQLRKDGQVSRARINMQLNATYEISRALNRRDELEGMNPDMRFAVMTVDQFSRCKQGFRSDDFTLVGKNFYQTPDMRHWRLFAIDETPNGCWLIGAEFREVLHIAVEGREFDRYGQVVKFEIGTVQSRFEYIRISRVE